MSDKLKNTWKQIKAHVNESLVFKTNDPNNTQDRVTPFNPDFYKKPIGSSNPTVMSIITIYYCFSIENKIKPFTDILFATTINIWNYLIAIVHSLYF